MFNFFDMMNNYEDRKIDRFENKDVMVDTCSVSDGSHPYETAVQHIFYNNNVWIIVQAYDTKEEAQEGHNKWVKIMTSEPLPDYLMDCNNSGISQLADEICGEDFLRFPRQDKK